jgi:hypothetical protein
MHGNAHRTFKSDPKYPTPESAARELLRHFCTQVTEAWPYAYVGVANMDFTRGGGTIAEYRSGIDYGVAQGWFAIDGGGRCDRPRQGLAEPSTFPVIERFLWLKPLRSL